MPYSVRGSLVRCLDCCTLFLSVHRRDIVPIIVCLVIAILVTFRKIGFHVNAIVLLIIVLLLSIIAFINTLLFGYSDRLDRPN